MLERDRRDSRTENTFVLPADTPPGPVSVVSDFNERKPGTHEPTRRPEGTRAVTVALPSEASHSSRYLAVGDYWFNDDRAEPQLDGSNRLTT
ncbi:hypothetical protein ACIA6E_00930 [Streptomyces sp. NPDC051815]|uniref:hypothetical protein n=1 Tax=Streptomyces sp. NPDC051815 TaxID=3365674 RepID=UPI0037B1718C